MLFDNKLAIIIKSLVFDFRLKARVLIKFVEVAMFVSLHSNRRDCISRVASGALLASKINQIDAIKACIQRQPILFRFVCYEDVHNAREEEREREMDFPVWNWREKTTRKCMTKVPLCTGKHVRSLVRKFNKKESPDFND